MVDTETMYQNFLDTREEPQVTLYKNDLKYKDYRKLDLDKYNLTDVEDMDTFEYRMKECMESGGKELDISHLFLTKIPKLPKTLTHLYCSDNDISDLGDLSYLINLKILDCTNNNLVSIKYLPQKLTELNCKYNKLIDIDVISNCKKLTHLNCSNNKLKNIPNHPNIKILDCSDNKLNNIIMANLRSLTCNTNCIKELNDYKKIESLHIYNNLITKIPYYDQLLELVCDYSDTIKISKKYDLNSTLVGLDKTVLMVFNQKK